MRTYRRNSPQAAARIVALTMLADGNLCRTELAVLEQSHAHETLNISPADMLVVVQEVCEDMLSASHLTWMNSCAIDPATLGELMAEVDDTQLRKDVAQLCAAVVAADAHLADGESVILTAVATHWSLPTSVRAPA